MIRVQFTAAVFALATFVVPSRAEIVPSQCRLIRYGGIDTPVENFPCDFRQSGGNVTVDSKNWAFTFLERNQGKTFIRINSIPLTFTRTGRYTLQVTQGPRIR
ncbi:hypothetical protein [Synechococcus sp. Cu2B8-bc1011]|uniref:hypothetical protein n=1 Tax=Synechococcus sp. Cu2B8-bc1011 TaxID=3093725 RepID=UPI0039AF7DD3